MIVDTSVWIDYFNGYPSQEEDRLTRAIADNEIIILPGIVVTEILLGLKNDKEADRIANLLSAFEPAPELERLDYIEAARLYRECRVKGITVRSTIDCLIGQLCLRYGYDLLTKDRDFIAIARCVPLQLIQAL